MKVTIKGSKELSKTLKSIEGRAKRAVASALKEQMVRAPELRLLVTGSRDGFNEARIIQEITRVIAESGADEQDILIIEGEADGVDRFVADLCHKDLGIACAGFAAAWEAYAKRGNKRSAGPIRNGWMLRWGRPNFVLAFHPFIVNSRGTKNMVKQARDKHIPVRIIDK